MHRWLRDMTLKRLDQRNKVATCMETILGWLIKKEKEKIIAIK